MSFLLRTLSLSYVRRHLAKTLLTVLGVLIGVATFTAIQAARSTLVQGLRSTVDRMAGKAQLQVASPAGVPEELQETLREVEGIRAQAPVIEQLVLPERADLGTLLVVGVDLLGDREMREYGFQGEDADLDDPLLFLAQPDSVALARPYAERAGVRQGDRLRLRVPQGVREVAVRAILEPRGFATAFGGNLAVMDVYAAQDLFGKGRRFDRIEVRLEPSLALDEGRALVERLVGPGYQVETPARRGENMERLISSFLAGFSITSLFALGIGIFLIFNAFAVAVNRRRRDVGTLRALGATPRQVQLLFLVEAAWVGAVGGLLGLAVGSLLSQAALAAMGKPAEQIYGLADASRARLGLPVVLEALALGLLASLAGAWLPARSAARIAPTDALARGRFDARMGPPRPLRLAAGAILLLAAVALAVVRPGPAAPLCVSIIALAALAATLLVTPAARALVLALAPALARLAPVSGRLAADALVSNPRRTSGTVLAMTLSLAFVIGTSTYLGSTRQALTRWMDDQLTSDLYVRASANFTRPDFRYPAHLRDELLAVPGVRAVESYRGMRIPFRGDEVMLTSIEIEALLARTSPEWVQGDGPATLAGVARGGGCAVSDNFRRRFGLGRGDTLELSTPSGQVRLPIVSVLTDYTSDKGSIWLDRRRFLELWRDDRVDVFDVSIQPGVDPLRVRDRITRLLSGRMPALVSTREEFVAEIGRAVDAFYVLMRITLLVALLVAFLGIVSSLIVSVSERTREIGILKALGAVGGQIARSVTFEALVVALVGFLLALPLGILDARFLETTVADSFSGIRIPHGWDYRSLVQLLVLLPVVSALAAWIPARTAARTPVTQAIVYE